MQTAFSVACVASIALLVGSVADHDAALRGTWKLTEEFELSGLWMCPNTARTPATPKQATHHYQIAEYISPHRAHLYTMAEAISILSARFPMPLNVAYIGDSLFRQRFFAGMCIAELDNLSMQSEHIHSRWLGDNPCGCHPQNNTDTHYTGNNYARCEGTDAQDKWEFLTRSSIITFGAGPWFSQWFLGCFSEEGLEEAYGRMLTAQIPLMKRYIEAGKLVFWFGLPYAVSTVHDYSHHTFRSRNMMAKRILEPAGVTVIDAYDLVRERVVQDPRCKCDDLHFCGFGPHSVQV